jgi:hypothetical protein
MSSAAKSRPKIDYVKFATKSKERHEKAEVIRKKILKQEEERLEKLEKIKELKNQLKTNEKKLKELKKKINSKK